MGGILKGIASVLIALGIIAVVGTGVILYYNTIAPEDEEAAVAETEGTDLSLPERDGAAETEVSQETEADAPEQLTYNPEDLPAGSSSTVFTAENGHVHTYTSNILKPATCTEPGEMKHTCYCGDTYVDSIPAKDHTPGQWITVRAATTTQTGLRQKSCLVCGRTLEEETLPMLTDNSKNTSTSSNNNNNTSSSHKHSYTYEITTEATCTSQGEKTFTCATCGSTFKTKIPATNHPSRSTVRTEGDCKNDGKIETKCNICNTVISSEPITYDHHWGSWTTTTQPTATSNGVQTRTCTVCGESESRTLKLSGSATTTVSGSTGTTGSTGTSGSSTDTSGSSGSSTHKHVYVSAVTTPATCTENGVTTYTCTAGDDTYTEDLPLATGHREGNWITTVTPTTTTSGTRVKYCTVCGQIVQSETLAPLIDSHTHIYVTTILTPATSTSQGLAKHTCSVCGYYYTTTIPAAS